MAAPVQPKRQTTQYTCVSTSVSMCLEAYGLEVTEAEVNRVLGAEPMRGASWEEALGCLQYFGFRGTLVVPSTLKQVKAWTDAGIPVIIGYNPEGRPWSHASVIFDVAEDLTVSIADPNIPDPEQLVRTIPKDEFYKMWSEKVGDILVRRPALAVEREITLEGKQVMASNLHFGSGGRFASTVQALKARMVAEATKVFGLTPLETKKLVTDSDLNTWTAMGAYRLALAAICTAAKNLVSKSKNDADRLFGPQRKQDWDTKVREFKSQFASLKDESDAQIIQNSYKLDLASGKKRPPDMVYTWGSVEKTVREIEEDLAKGVRLGRQTMASSRDKLLRLASSTKLTVEGLTQQAKRMGASSSELKEVLASPEAFNTHLASIEDLLDQDDLEKLEALDEAEEPEDSIEDRFGTGPGKRF